jgi:hypothetical protein
MRLFCASLLLFLMSLPVMAQIETAPIPPPAEQSTELPPADAAPRVAEPPPVLPLRPRRRAHDAAARGGAGGMSYAGPSGAMNTSPQGSACAVTCTLQPPEEHQVSCPPGYTALCQCDAPPYSVCRRQ